MPKTNEITMHKEKKECYLLINKINEIMFNRINWLHFEEDGEKLLIRDGFNSILFVELSYSSLKADLYAFYLGATYGDTK